MSYCVNCGVKLNQNISTCPLCGVQVINPVDPIDQSAGSKMPLARDVYESAFDRNLWVKIVSTMLAIPILLTITINTIFKDGLSWSPYVIGSLVLVWVWLISPFIFNSCILSRWIIIDAAALLGFLFLIEYLSRFKGWFLSLALPMIVYFTILLLIIVMAIRQKILKELHIVASIFLGIGFFCVFLNGIINYYEQGILSLDWSLLVLIPFTAFAITAIFLQQKRWVVEELKHWFRI